MPRTVVPKEKILAIKFKSLGDVVICTPALKALKKSKVFKADAS